MLRAREHDGASTGAIEAAAPAGVEMDVQTFWRNAWRPTDLEESYEITDIEGEIPRELNGTLFRNGPSQKIQPQEGYEALHLFDGDGLVNAFRFEDGRVSYQGRFVESPTYLIEQQEGRACFAFVGVDVPDPSDQALLRQTHNTNIVHHAGKLMALVENAPPFEIDPKTLGPVGYDDFQGKIFGMSTTAHPKIDGRTGQMLIHGYQPFEPYVQLYVIEPDGTCSLAEPIETPYPVMAHDFAITENYVVLPLGPVLMDGERLMNGQPYADTLSWQPEKGLKFAIRPRAAGGQVQWFEAPNPGYMFHPGNAYEKDGKIYMDACTYVDGVAFLDDIKKWRRGEVTPQFGANPFLYEFDLATGVCRERKLDDRGAEFPRMDDRRMGYENRWGYAVLSRPGDKAGEPGYPWSRVMKYDRQGGPSAIHDYGRWHWPNEPVFVPRTATSSEDDGFVVNYVYDGTDDSSYLAILDAQNMDQPLLAKARLKHRLPQGFHGNFVAGLV